MKKITLIMIALILVLGSIPVYAEGNLKDDVTSLLSTGLSIAEGLAEGLADRLGDILSQSESYFRDKIKKFTDMGSHWADITVGKLVELGAINGYEDGTFKPNGNITRAEFSKILRNAFQIEKIEGNTFSDTSSHWAKDEIHTLASLGIIKIDEYGDSYEPNKKITRIEIAKMVIRAINEDGKADVLMGNKTRFNDDEKIEYHDKGYVIVATENGIINGYPNNTFKPNGLATRGEASKLLINTLEYYINKQETIENPENPENPEDDGFFNQEISFEYYRYKTDQAGMIVSNKNDFFEYADTDDPYYYYLECINEDKLNYFVTINSKREREQVSRLHWRKYNGGEIRLVPIIFSYDVNVPRFIMDMNKIYKYKLIVKRKDISKEYIIEIDPQNIIMD